MVLVASLFDPLATFSRTWGPFLLLLLSSSLAGYLFERFVIATVQRLARNTKTELDDIIVAAIHPALAFLVVVAGVFFGIRYLRASIPPEVFAATDSLSYAIIALFAAMVVARLLRGFLFYQAKNRRQWHAAASLASRTVSVVIYVIALLVVFHEYRIEITPLLTAAGLGGLAVALALQDTLSNFFAGIWVQTGRSLRPGHFVRVGDAGIEGYVVEVGWRTTQLQTLQNNLVVIPNSRIAQSVITDYHLPHPHMALYLPIGVGYESDPAQIERILVEEALSASAATSSVLADPKPEVRFSPGFGDWALQFTLVVYVREFTEQYRAETELRKRILARFRKEGIRIPYPLRETFQVPPGRPDVASAAADPNRR